MDYENEIDGLDAVAKTAAAVKRNPYQRVIDAFNAGKIKVGARELTHHILYDSATYAAGGQSILNFFQDAIGQNNKTKHDTNMPSSGSLPQPQGFLVESIEVDFKPGVNRVITAATAADAIKSRSNDLAAFYESGHFELTNGSQVALAVAPLQLLPSQNGIESEGSTATTVAATNIVIDAANLKGGVFKLKTPIVLLPGQNFKVELSWKNNVAMPSGAAGKVWVRLNGFLAKAA